MCSPHCRTTFYFDFFRVSWVEINERHLKVTAEPIKTEKLYFKTFSVPVWQSNTDAFGALRLFHRKTINLDPKLYLARRFKSTEKRSERLYLSLITIIAEVWLYSSFTSLQRKGEPSPVMLVKSKQSETKLILKMPSACLFACCLMTPVKCPVYLYFYLKCILVRVCQSCAKGM